MPKITSSAKAGDFNTFDNTVRDAGHAVCALTESAAQVNHSVMVFVYRVRKHFARIFFAIGQFLFVFCEKKCFWIMIT